MKIVFVNRFFYPDHSATSQMLSDVAFALAERGHSVSVITSKLRYDGDGRPLPRREVVCGVNVVRIATSGYGRGGLMGRSIDYVTFYFAAAWAVVWHIRRGDIVVGMTDPPLLSIVLLPITWVRGARLVNWLQDIFPETASALGFSQGVMSRALFAGLRFLRDLSLTSAAHSVVIGQRMAQRVEALGVARNRISVIHNWVDGAAIFPIDPDRNELRRAWGLDRAFVVGYSGNLGRAHDVGTMITAIERVEAGAEPGRGPVRWLIIGGGVQSSVLREAAAKKGLKSLRFEPYQPRERLAESLSVADIHLVSLKPELEGLIVPSKFYGIAAAGRPAIFIGDADGEIARILKQACAGVVVEQGDADGLTSAVLAAAQDAETTSVKGVAARRFFEASFDLPRAVEAWEGVLVAVRGGGLEDASADKGTSHVPVEDAN